ncbi:5726_t:CDS:1 [Paraglomus brasilianum]|uniref:5726_t:CDS:1 n=1 Tax=Paraglomus brasilianum TaxID=144538 RepID=A0A9N9AJ64_9GLOM|nr:5726_t:CDS:1 [Paraglomus brasilianum]
MSFSLRSWHMLSRLFQWVQYQQHLQEEQQRQVQQQEEELGMLQAQQAIDRQQFQLVFNQDQQQQQKIDLLQRKILREEQELEVLQQQLYQQQQRDHLICNWFAPFLFTVWAGTLLKIWFYFRQSST